MSYTYTTYVDELVRLTVTGTPDADFTSNLPSVIDYAENRIYRELNLLATVVRDDSQSVAANNRSFTLPQSLGRFVAVSGINIFTPSSAGSFDGTRNALMPASRDYIDFTWPSNTAPSSTTVPAYYAMITDQIVILGPPPGDNFLAEIVGTIRPTPLSAVNATTYLTLYLPDLFLAASMVFMTGFMRNFGSQADDPKMAVSWESQYAALAASANTEEMRKKYSDFMKAA
jgi:hypothetical protein